jgi:hypothetical protein
VASDSSVIFRFITVRGPRKPTSDEVDTGFIAYDPKLNAAVVKAYIAAGPQGAQGAAQQYKDSPDFITSPDEIEERQAGLVAFADWLTAEAHRLTHAQLKEIRKRLKVTPKAGMLTWLWDNLATHVLVGGRPEIRETIIGAMKVYNVLERLHEEREDKDRGGKEKSGPGKGRPEKEELTDALLQRLASATVLMPAVRKAEKPGRGERKAKSHKPEPPPKEPGPQAKVEEGLLRMAKLQNAAEELTRHLHDEIDRGRAMAPRALRVPSVREGCIDNPPDESADEEKLGQIPHDAVTLSPTTLSKFSKSTQAELREAGIESGMRLPYAIQRLQTQAAYSSQEGVQGVKAEQRVVRAGGAFWVHSYGQPHGHLLPPVPGRDDEFYGDFFVNDRECQVYPLGVADYRRVEQRLYCYEPGEVAHIENVMQGESKERTTRSLRRSEDTFTTATDTETTTEHDTQTTDRFEIEKEATKVVDTELSFELGVQVQASYGPVKIQADTKFAVSYATTESDRQASRYGHDVTDRALDRVVKKVREERITKLITEYEETNKHTLEGGEDQHVVGLFRWVDKVYEARIVNYGKRLMFEFMVPEPGAFHLHAMTKEPAETSVTLTKPIDPRSKDLPALTGLPTLTSHLAVTEFNYAAYAAAYEARVDPPPASFQTASKAYHREGMDHNVQFADSKNDLKMPEGYEASSFVAPFGLHSENHNGGNNWVTIAIGKATRFSTSGGTFSSVLAGEDDIVPMVVMGRTRFYALNVEVLCSRTPQALEKWKIKVFNAIMDAYNTKLAAYNNALADAKSRSGIEIRGTNPLGNRVREQLELEKSCVRLLAQQCDPLWSNAMKDKQECDYPEFECCEAIRDGSYVQFVEQCFDWRLMTYLFYPYFWGRKCNWEKIYQIEDVDPLFLLFLQAGYARVAVPVREGYEHAALRFLADGTPWDGGGIPGVNDPLYVAIANEMKEPVGKVDPTVTPWKIRVPTTLTVLQCESGCAPGQGLPCPGPTTPWP